MPTNTPSSPWDEKCLQTATLQTELLRITDLPHPQAPEAPEARSLVAELNGVEFASGAFIIESISALTKSQATAQLPRVIVVEHQAGVNDLMTGAMSLALQPRRTLEELAHITRDDNNATLYRFDFRSLGNFMPYRLFNIREIATLDIFHALDNINRLPEGFHTSTLGLKKVWFEIWKGQVNAVYDDQQLLTELAKIGGVPRQHFCQENRTGVVYPEDLVPCTSEDEWDNDHRMYWKMLWDLRRTSWGLDEVEQMGTSML